MKKKCSGTKTGFHNMAFYDPEENTLEIGVRLPCEECSVISLATTRNGIYVVTMDTNHFLTSLYFSDGSSAWSSFSVPELADGTPLTLLFDNLIVDSDSNSTFALGYVASTESLSNKSIRFYLLRWDLTPTTARKFFFWKIIFLIILKS